MRTLFHARAFWYHHQGRGRFPLPTTEKWGEGQGEGISKERDNSTERAPFPSPLPARPSQGEGPLRRWWVYQDAPRKQSTLADNLTVGNQCQKLKHYGACFASQKALVARPGCFAPEFASIGIGRARPDQCHS